MPARTLLPARDYNLDATLNSGQAFRWNHCNGHWEGVISRHTVRLSRHPAGIEAWATPPVDDWDWLVHYLQIEVDLHRILVSFPNDDPHLAAAERACHGLRLLRQDPWECLASFILSSTKQIVQIRRIIELLCNRFGETLPSSPQAPCRRAFPTARTIAACSETDLRACRMGFRAPALLTAARRIVAGSFPLADLGRLSTADARKRLQELPGVGDKIADCVLLFALGKADAFPIDVWVRRALRTLYFPGRPVRPVELREFARMHFGPYAGYAQQYLFHYMRVHLGGPR